MFEYAYIIYVLASLSALCGSYALIMSMLKKSPNVLWTRGEAVFTLASTGVALGFGYKALFSSENMYTIISILFLIIGLANALALVLVHRFKMATELEYPAPLATIIKTLSIITFIFLLLHFTFTLLSIANF